MRRGYEMSGSQAQTAPAQPASPQAAKPAPAQPAASFNPFVGNTVGTDLLVKSFGPTQPVPASLPRGG